MAGIFLEAIYILKRCLLSVKQQLMDDANYLNKCLCTQDILAVSKPNTLTMICQQTKCGAVRAALAFYQGLELGFVYGGLT